MSHRVPPDSLAVMNRQLCTLLNAGMPMDHSLNTVAAQCDSILLRDVLQQARRSILAGASSLTEAFEKGPNVFPAWYLDLLRAGEKEDKLIPTLEEAAIRFDEEIPYYRRKIRLRNALIVLLALLVLWFVGWRFGMRTAGAVIAMGLVAFIAWSFFGGSSATITITKK